MFLCELAVVSTSQLEEKPEDTRQAKVSLLHEHTGTTWDKQTVDKSVVCECVCVCVFVFVFFRWHSISVINIRDCRCVRSGVELQSVTHEPCGSS